MYQTTLRKPGADKEYSIVLDGDVNPEGVRVFRVHSEFTLDKGGIRRPILYQGECESLAVRIVCQKVAEQKNNGYEILRETGALPEQNPSADDAYRALENMESIDREIARLEALRKEHESVARDYSERNHQGEEYRIGDLGLQKKISTSTSVKESKKFIDHLKKEKIFEKAVKLSITNLRKLRDKISSDMWKEHVRESKKETFEVARHGDARTAAQMELDGIQ